MIEINKDPSPRELRWFGVLLVLFFALVGALVRWRLDAPRVGAGLWVAGGTLALIYLVLPRLRRAIYLAWLYAAYPIGWTISHLLLLFVYYAILTPIGLLLRLAGKDPLERRQDRSAPSYWSRRDQDQDVKSYFRQF